MLRNHLSKAKGHLVWRRGFWISVSQSRACYHLAISKNVCHSPRTRALGFSSWHIFRHILISHAILTYHADSMPRYQFRSSLRGKECFLSLKSCITRTMTRIQDLPSPLNFLKIYFSLRTAFKFQEKPWWAGFKNIQWPHTPYSATLRAFLGFELF